MAQNSYRHDPDRDYFNDFCPRCGAHIPIRWRDIVNRTQRIECECGHAWTVSVHFEIQRRSIRRNRR